MNASITQMQKVADRLRLEIVKMVQRGKGSHVGSAFSCLDILVVLYETILHVNPHHPNDPTRDYCLLSKGHAAAALYAVLAEHNWYPRSNLKNYLADDSEFIGHTNAMGVLGVEFSTGSLGHGLPVGNGLALAAKRNHADNRIFVILSDGDCQEGSTWEAALFTAHHKLDNVIAIIDCNGIQCFGTVPEVLNLEPLADKWRAFGWDVKEIDGHDFTAIANTLSMVPFSAGRPSVVLARTVKGKGISFMENQLKWHYQTPSADDLAQCQQELESKL